MRALQKGEYDLVNISLIGFDPITGRSYEACADEWERECARVAVEAKTVRWWQIVKRIRIARSIFVLRQRQGFAP